MTKELTENEQRFEGWEAIPEMRETLYVRSPSASWCCSGGFNECLLAWLEDKERGYWFTRDSGGWWISGKNGGEWTQDGASRFWPCLWSAFKHWEAGQKPKPKEKEKHKVPQLITKDQQEYVEGVRRWLRDSLKDKDRQVCGAIAEELHGMAEELLQKPQEKTLRDKLPPLLIREAFSKSIEVLLDDLEAVFAEHHQLDMEGLREEVARLLEIDSCSSPRTWSGFGRREIVKAIMSAVEKHTEGV